MCFKVTSIETLPLRQLEGSPLMLKKLQIEDTLPVMPKSTNKLQMQEWITIMAAELKLKGKKNLKSL
jgi:hypothetical protein